MTNPDDPAFPIENDKLRDAEISPYGLSKREYFAGLAMQSLIYIKVGYDDPNASTLIANGALTVADALIEALNKKEK